MAQLAQQMAEAREGLCFLVTGTNSVPDINNFPPDTVAQKMPADHLPDVRAFLRHFRPRMVVLTELVLPPALIHETHARRISLALVDVDLSEHSAAPWRWGPGMAASLLRRFDLILARDAASAQALQKLAKRQLAVDVTGQIEDTPEPLPYAENEREELAQLMRVRPVWFAVNCPEREEAAVISAQLHAMPLAHRLLLIFAPIDKERGKVLAEKLANAGVPVALRSRDEEPEDEVEIFIIDTDEDLGLWYRLAPVTYMGGTLTKGNPNRDPFEPAALGSAILHGPNVAPYGAGYTRLAEADATRPVANADALAHAVADLISPETAAVLAHRAWIVSSAGAEVTHRITELLMDQMDAARGRG